MGLRLTRTLLLKKNVAHQLVLKAALGLGRGHGTGLTDGRALQSSNAALTAPWLVLASVDVVSSMYEPGGNVPLVADRIETSWIGLLPHMPNKHPVRSITQARESHCRTQRGACYG